MIRLHLIVEGQTEETFVNTVLADYLGAFQISVDVRRVETSRSRGRVYRGGVLDYARVKRDIALWMKQDQRLDAFFSTMFDLYALPQDFPGYAASQHLPPFERVDALEQAFAQDMQHARFIPYLQLHEFEALLLADPQQFEWEFIEHDQAIRQLVEMTATFDSPELIDDGQETAPSKRIIQVIPEYAGQKPSSGPLIAAKIGVPTLRAACPHFDAWLTRLSTLHQSSETPV